MNDMDLCPCSSEKTFVDCCKPLLENQKIASTPLELMRSRFTAHACKNMPHIIRTMRGKPLKLFDEDKTRDEWFDQCVWTKLEVIDAPDVKAGDKEGIVEFKAHFEFKDKPQFLHERSKFQLVENKWYYVSGQNKAAHIETSTKVGRNDPCACGSGKKFKKCCAVA